MADLQEIVNQQLHYRGEDFRVTRVEMVDGEVKTEVEPPQQTVSDTLARTLQQSLEAGKPVSVQAAQKELDLM